MKAKKTKEHDLSADLVRVYAIFGVVFLHSDSVTSSLTNYVGGTSWWLAVFFQSLFRVSVPLFVMLSGYLWLEVKKDVPTFKEMLKRSFLRIGLPLITWSSFYFYWQGYWKRNLITPNQALLKFINADVFHLYFLFIIIGLYLLLPFIKKYWIKQQFKSKLLIAVALLCLSMIWLAVDYFILHGYGSSNAFLIFLPYLGYFLLGSLVRNYKLRCYHKYLMAVSILLLTTLTSYLYALHISAFSKGNLLFWTNSNGYYFWENFSPNQVVMSTLTFWLLMSSKNWIKKLSGFKLKPILKNISLASFGIYLIHPLVIDLVEHYLNYSVHLISGNLWIYLIKKVSIVFTFSYVLVVIGEKIPIIRLFLFGNIKYDSKK